MCRRGEQGQREKESGRKKEWRKAPAGGRQKKGRRRARKGADRRRGRRGFIAICMLGRAGGREEGRRNPRDKEFPGSPSEEHEPNPSQGNRPPSSATVRRSSTFLLSTFIPHYQCRLIQRGWMPHTFILCKYWNERTKEMIKRYREGQY